MIEKIHSTYKLVCDCCGDYADEDFDDFYGAVDFKKSYGWKSQRCGDVWQDICPECQEVQ